MEKRTKGCLLIGLGVFLLLLMVGVAVIGGAGYWLYHQFSSAVTERAPEQAASELDAIRGQFGDQAPLLTIDEGDSAPRLVPDSRAPEHGEPLTALHIAAYDPDDRHLLRFSVPFWLLRLSPDGKLSIGDDALEDVRGVEQLTVEDLERYGPGLLLDERQPDGGRVIVWTE